MTLQGRRLLFRTTAYPCFTCQTQRFYMRPLLPPQGTYKVRHQRASARNDASDPPTAPRTSRQTYTCVTKLTNAQSKPFKLNIKMNLCVCSHCNDWVFYEILKLWPTSPQWRHLEAGWLNIAADEMIKYWFCALWHKNRFFFPLHTCPELSSQLERRA